MCTPDGTSTQKNPLSSLVDRFLFTEHKQKNKQKNQSLIEKGFNAGIKGTKVINSYDTMPVYSSYGEARQSSEPIRAYNGKEEMFPGHNLKIYKVPVNYNKEFERLDSFINRPSDMFTQNLESHTRIILKLLHGKDNIVKITVSPSTFKSFLLEVNDNKIYIEYQIDQIGQFGKTFSEFMEDYHKRVCKHIVNLHKEQNRVDTYVDRYITEDIKKHLPVDVDVKIQPENRTIFVTFLENTVQINYKLCDYYITFDELIQNVMDSSGSVLKRFPSKL